MTQEPTTAWAVGDMLPAISMPGPDGHPVDFLQQARAGRTRLFRLSDGWPDAALLDRLTAAAPAFAAAEADLVIVACGVRPDPSRRLEPMAVRIVLDPDRRLPALIGIDRGLVLIDPRDKVALIDPADDLEAALRRCVDAHEQTPGATLGWGAPVLVIEQVIEPALCATLIDYWEQGRKVADQVAGTKEQKGTSSIKKRADVYIEDRLLFDGLKTRLGRRVIPEIRRAFAFDVTRFEALRIGCYDSVESGFFARHRDNRTPFTAHRRFAMTLNLNTGSYAGGELRFPEFGRQLYQAEAGGAVIFSCSLLHEALPVTAGRRFGLFTFLYDEAGAEIERRNQQRQPGLQAQGVRLS